MLNGSPTHKDSPNITFVLLNHYKQCHILDSGHLMGKDCLGHCCIPGIEHREQHIVGVQ